MNRSFETFFSDEQLHAYQAGVMSYEYRGLPCLKSPIDIAIYLRLLQEAKPKTLFEIGARAGGSALLFRDFASILNLKTNVVSIDLKVPNVLENGIRFLEGDVHDLQSCFERHRLFGLARPWMVVEDSAHTKGACLAALEFFAAHLAPNEWIVIEDGVLADLEMQGYEGGPNAAISEFFSRYPDVFDVGERYCDMFGSNATYNPNGYLLRTGNAFG